MRAGPAPLALGSFGGAAAGVERGSGEAAAASLLVATSRVEFGILLGMCGLPAAAPSARSVTAGRRDTAETDRAKAPPK
jgi:hypothetical protein